MRYLSYYKEYPIYEPAEGGYYYAGNQLVKSERLSKRQCRRKFEKIWQECQEENKKNGFAENADWLEKMAFIRGADSLTTTYAEKAVM